MKKWDLKGIADLTRLLGTKTWVCESNPQKRVLLRYGFFSGGPPRFHFFLFSFISTWDLQQNMGYLLPSSLPRFLFFLGEEGGGRGRGP